MKFEEFDAAHYLESEDDIAIFLEDMLENGTQADFVKALDTVARARGMTELARKTGIGRESLYKTLSSEKPRFETVVKIIDALGLQLSITPKSSSQTASV